LKVIHISDLHFTSSPHTLNSGDKGIFGIYLDNQDSRLRASTIAKFLIINRASLGTNIVIITGDLTDSGDENDYRIAQEFIQNLRGAGFEVYAVPGNHDYCKEGWLMLNKVVGMGLNLAFCPICPYLQVPYPPFCVCLHSDFGHAAPPGARCPIDVFYSDNATNQERRQRFNNYVTDGNNEKYPRVVNTGNLKLILLDSMQEELDGSFPDSFAQGRLGDNQLDLLQKFVANQEERNNGVKFVVALHHSPFGTDDKGGLRDATRFLQIIDHKVDCLIFGHVTPKDVTQQPGKIEDDEWMRRCEFGLDISLINCENLENVPKDSSYPITVLDLERLQRSVYQTIGGDPETSLSAKQIQLVTPTQIFPEDGVTFTNFPRTTTFQWEPVLGADYYMVEIEGLSPDGKYTNWTTSSGAISSTSYSLDFLGCQPGRWRIMAINQSGVKRTSSWSPWRTFKYTV